MTKPCGEIWLIRHGETASNAARILQGQTDSPLHDRGREQARSLGAWLSSSGVDFSSVVSSPLSRAAETARLATEALGLELSMNAQWMERSFGVLEGRPADVAWAAQDAAGDDPYAFEPDGGESTYAMAKRVCSAFEELADDVTRGPRALVFTHGGPLGAVITHALELPYQQSVVRRLRRDNTGITILRHKPIGWTANCINARPHLRP